VATKLSSSDAGTSYAIKSLNKESVLQRTSGLAAVHTELKALAILKDNKYICNVFYAFQDSQTLYLILDLAKGGDMR
jgi:serine/threonine protein kinase